MTPKLYPLIRKLLFMLPPEVSHYVALQALRCKAVIARYHPILRDDIFSVRPEEAILRMAVSKGAEKISPQDERKSWDLDNVKEWIPAFAGMTTRNSTVMNLHFPNPIGLAAGLDKNADYVDALASLGFGFIEIGSVTPKPQAGNPRPRLFRLVKDEAIINRMGFNNKGVDYVAERLARCKYRGVLGVNIGKNKQTTLENAAEDYLRGMRTLWPFASYFTINISSPNTPGLRELQHSEFLTHLLAELKHEQHLIHVQHQKYIPLVVKIAPDLTTDELAEIAAVLLAQKIDGVIATNTTIARPNLKSKCAHETGGLSGRPLLMTSTDVVRQLHAHLNDQIPIIAAGGIMDTESLIAKKNAGARLFQIYSGFIYRGPVLVRELVSSLNCTSA